MIWQNPIAWLGLAAIAVPVLLHLRSRRTRLRVRFPTLRFIDPSRLAPTRRRRITDVPLLLARVAIVVAAVAALAGPWLVTGEREARAGDRLVRAVVVDASQSMTRPDAAGRTALEDARVRAAALGGEADDARVVETGDADVAVAGAGAWLLGRSGRRELVVLSDFQAGTIHEDTLRALDPSIGLRMVRLGTDTPATTELGYRLGDLDATVTVTARADRTELSWRTRPADATEDDLLVLGGGGDGTPSPAAAARLLARLLGRPAGPMAIVLPDHPDRESLIRAARPVDRPWMFDVVEQVRRDASVRHAAAAETALVGIEGTALTPLATDSAGRPLASAAAMTVAGIERLGVFVATGADSAFTTAVYGSLPVPTAADLPADLRELDPDRLDEATIRQWERDATPATAATDRPADSDGRWLWLLALALLGVETWLRRPAPVEREATREVPRARVA